MTPRSYKYDVGVVITVLSYSEFENKTKNSSHILRSGYSILSVRYHAWHTIQRAREFRQVIPQGDTPQRREREVVITPLDVRYDHSERIPLTPLRTIGEHSG